VNVVIEIRSETSSDTFTADNGTTSTPISDADLFDSITTAPIFNPAPISKLEVITHEVKQHNDLLIPVIEVPLVQTQDTRDAGYHLDRTFSKKLDSHRDEVLQKSNILDNVVRSSVTISSAFSIGYVIWLVRGGLLIGSVMATLPAWRTIDPLPVLNQFNNDEDGDDETLQSMVDTNDQSANKQKEKSRGRK